MVVVVVVVVASGCMVVANNRRALALIHSRQCKFCSGEAITKFSIRF